MGGVPRLTHYAWLSIATAVATLTLKLGAWWVTGSVGLLSDALETVVNLVAASFTLAMLTVAARPPDDEHPHGHEKAEYFASGTEGALILLAAGGIIAAAIPRFAAPRPIEAATLGIAISAVASAGNLSTALALRRAGRRHGSLALLADAEHLLTDVWTSVGVIAAVAAVAVTGLTILDPIIAVVVAGQIVRTGAGLMWRSALGLLDTALEPDEQRAIEGVLARHRSPEVQFHAIRTRQAGTRRFISLHVLVPGAWTVQRGHELLEVLEEDLRSAVPRATVLTHLEPIEDEVSFADQALDRGKAGERGLRI